MKDPFLTPLKSHPTVVKLGGSLAYSPELPAWLAVLTKRPGRAVIVPGGGPFVDQVRSLQDQWHFDDSAAHGLAIAAMELFGRALVALQPGLVLAETAEAIEQALDDGRVPVWAPVAMTIGQPDIPESWEVTSDSLAAWLAGLLQVPRLVLIKSAGRAAEVLTAERLAASGMVDLAFPAFLSRISVDTWVLGPSQQDQLDLVLTGQDAPEAMTIAKG